MLTNQEIIIAVVVLIVVLFAIYYYYYHTVDKTFSMTDDATAVVALTCPSGKKILIDKATWESPKCDAADVTTGLGKLANGQNSYNIPATPFKATLLGVADPCIGQVKTLAGTYKCQ
jgi:hypothetical protein